ncbi:hypothetical protein KSP39_PZI010647 [Platanthera zijinensis]|uniref:Uncharacterized protein n=1 Tax=Platanthera zijinensis TaxID=2320716 RepID=A0AAP0G6E3_9ASPA
MVKKETTAQNKHQTQLIEHSSSLRSSKTQVGFEPTTSQLTADCSTTELLRNNGLKEADSRSLDQPMKKGVCHSFSHTPPGRKGYDSKPLPG